MNILIYSINYAPELTGIGKYAGEMAVWLSRRGHDIRVITSPPYYPEWKVSRGYTGWHYSKEIIDNVTVYRSPLFVPKTPTTFKRLLHLLSFAGSSFPLALAQMFWKPDAVLFVQPTLFASLNAIILARLSGAKLIMHVQDYEIDAMFGLNMMHAGGFRRLVQSLESWLMRRFDIVSTISHSMMENAKNKGISDSKLLHFPNWSSSDFITPDIDGLNIRSEWGFTFQDKVILYSGNIGKKQGLELVVEAAERLCSNNVLKFVIVGTGANLGELKSMVVNRRLSNVHFKPLQPWGRVPEMLASADVHLVVQKKGAADVVMPSKLTNILSAGGHAIVTADTQTEMGYMAEKFPGIYECIEPDNVEVFVDSLSSLLRKDLSKPNMVARNYAVEYLSKEKILSRFENDLKNLVEQKK